MQTTTWLETPVTLTRTGITSLLFLLFEVSVYWVHRRTTCVRPSKSLSCPVTATATKTLGTTVRLSSIAPSWTQTRTERGMSVMMTMTTMAFQTCCHLVLITAVWSPTLCRRTPMVGDGPDHCSHIYRPKKETASLSILHYLLRWRCWECLREGLWQWHHCWHHWRLSRKCWGDPHWLQRVPDCRFRSGGRRTDWPQLGGAEPG